MFVSRDLGASWSDLSARLPDRPFTDLLVNPFNGHLYASAGAELFMSRDHGATWERVDHGLPGAPVYAMQLDPAGNRLVVGTYGRGVWERSAP